MECHQLGCGNRFQSLPHCRSTCHKYLVGKDKLVELNTWPREGARKRKNTTQQLSLRDYRSPSSPKKQPMGNRGKTKNHGSAIFYCPEPKDNTARLSALHHPTGALLAVAVPSAVVAGAGAAAGTCGEIKGLTFWDVLDSSSEKVQGKCSSQLQKQGLLPERAAKMVLGNSLTPREKTKEEFCLVQALRTCPRQLSWQPGEKQEREHSVPVLSFKGMVIILGRLAQERYGTQDAYFGLPRTYIGLWLPFDSSTLTTVVRGCFLQRWWSVTKPSVCWHHCPSADHAPSLLSHLVCPRRVCLALKKSCRAWCHC